MSFIARLSVSFAIHRSNQAGPSAPPQSQSPTDTTLSPRQSAPWLSLLVRQIAMMAIIKGLEHYGGPLFEHVSRQLGG